MFFYLQQYRKISLGEGRLYNSPDYNRNVAGAKCRPHCNGKRDYRFCRSFYFASNNKILKLLITSMMLIFVQDVIAQTTENTITNLKQEVTELLPYYQTELQTVTKADLPVTLIINEKNYKNLISYDAYLQQSLSENGVFNIFVKKCMIYIESSKIVSPPRKSTLSEEPVSKPNIID